jgi:hypothetical protein
MMCRAFILVLVALFSIYQVQAVLISCGGFVRLSAELSKYRQQQDQSKGLGLDQVKIELITPEGLVKETAECAPNGYYLLPLYDKGRFLLRLRGPPGWTFEPETVEVDQPKCEQGKDIDFLLTGFTLTGQVVDQPSNRPGCVKHKGPAGVTVRLNNGKTERSNKTVAEGYYSFSSIVPGSYTLKVSHPHWTFSQPEVKINVGWGNWNIREDFVVIGYQVSGSVVAQDNDPVPGVSFLLFPVGPPPATPLHCSPVTSNFADEGVKPLCEARSDEQGIYTFSNISCGNYLIKPFYQSEHTTFDLYPQNQPVFVSQGDVEVAQPFHVTGFSVSGRVVDTAGAGISGVTIIVNGQEQAISNTDGYYHLDQMSAGTYSIEASKDHMFFESLKPTLSPSQSRIPTMHVTRFDSPYK